MEGIRLFRIVSGDVTGENATDRMELVSLEVQRVTALSVDAAGEHPKKTYPWAWVLRSCTLMYDLYKMIKAST